MSHTMIAAFTCHAIHIVLGGGFSLVYMTRSMFMPYHRQAVGKPWAELPGPEQILIRALLNSVGALGSALALAVGLMLLIPFREGRTWAIFAIPALGLLVAFASLAIMRMVKRHTAGRPPIAGAFVTMALNVAGLALSLL